MDIKTVKKFDALLKKSTNGGLDTFEEISEILVGFIILEVDANYSVLMQRVTQKVTFASTKDMQDFLSAYFDFNNAIVAEFERLENIDDEDEFEKAIQLFTRNILKTIPQENLKEAIFNFVVKIIKTIINEYDIEVSDDFEKMVRSVQEALGIEDITMMFMATSSIVPTLDNEKLSFDKTVDLVVVAFVLCFEMNLLRKNAHLTREAFTNAPKPVNSLTYNVGRNDPCPCGSGRKYKKCCLNKSKPMPLSLISFEEPKDVAPPLTQSEIHEFYTIWSRFVNFVSKVYSEVSEQKYIKIYAKNEKGELFFTPEASKEYHYITIRNFITEYFHKLVDHFIDDNRVSQKNIAILYGLREGYRKDNVYVFETFSNGNAILYAPKMHSCYYIHKLFADSAKVFPKAKMFEVMFFNYQNRIITDSVTATYKEDVGENMQNIIKDEYEKDRANLLFSLPLHKEQKKEIYQLKISIKGAKPPIWRRVLLESDMNFYALHKTIQAIFNWEDCHLYQFYGNRANYSDKEFLEEESYLGDKKNYAADMVSIDNEFKKIGDKVRYIYDFGDDWEHEIVFEDIEAYDESLKYPVCIKGKRNGPMEDCGGIYNFNVIADAIENPTFENQYILGGDGESYYDEEYDPKEFDIERINRKLRARF